VPVFSHLEGVPPTSNVAHAAQSRHGPRNRSCFERKMAGAPGVLPGPPKLLLFDPRAAAAAPESEAFGSIMLSDAGLRGTAGDETVQRRSTRAVTRHRMRTGTPNMKTRSIAAKWVGGVGEAIDHIRPGTSRSTPMGSVNRRRDQRRRNFKLNEVDFGDPVLHQAPRRNFAPMASEFGFWAPEIGMRRAISTARRSGSAARAPDQLQVPRISRHRTTRREGHSVCKRKGQAVFA